MTVTICWFRRNLRLADNAALRAALNGASAVVPLFVFDNVATAHAPGPASRAWLNRSLTTLDAGLRERGSCLITRSGVPASQLARVAEECRAVRVHCQRDWTPAGMAEERAARDALATLGVVLEVAEGQLLVPPDAIATQHGDAYRVFTPYWRAFQHAWEPPAPSPAPDALPRPVLMPPSAGPVSARSGAPDVGRYWSVGEAESRARLGRFVAEALREYADDRDRPDLDGTSRLSPALAWGELSAAQVAAAVASAASDVAEPYLRQLAWREFAYHVAHHFPHSLDEPLNKRFSSFPWCDDPAGLEAWRTGHTGYPLVDAGMRQLAATGWMHNRVRLVCGSFLTKHLLQPWQTGAKHFNDRLVDYDPALNAFNWQWVAGSGADAAPYFRIFNPALQGARFDADGTYVRAWVPELARLDARWIHRPHAAPAEALAAAGVRLGENYPLPIIEHAEARERALAAFASLGKR